MESEDAIKVRYTQEGKDFEILVNPDEALEYRRGDTDDISHALYVREVFKDVSSAEKVSEKELREIFGTKDILKAADKILQEGKMELTTKQRNEIRSKKKRQIVNMIARRAKDPQRNAPHPPERIENAMKEAKVNIDALEPAEEQMEDVVDKIRPILPISFEKVNLALKIPNKHAGKCYNIIKKMGDLEEEEWGDEYFFAKLKAPAGVSSELLEKLEKTTSGNMEVKEF